MKSLLIVFLVWNITVMLIYGTDKLKAKRASRRIRESVLLFCAFALGGWGAMLGMVFFNHKTAKMKFRLLVPTAFMLSIAAIYFVIRYGAIIYN